MLLLAPGGEGQSAVQAACAWFPVTDLARNVADRERANLPRPVSLQGIPLPQPSMEARLLGVEDAAAEPELAHAASPVTHAARATGPVLLFHGDEDGWVNVCQSERMHRALLDAGRDSQLLTVAGANHQDDAFDGPAVLGAVAGFFAMFLSGPPESPATPAG